MESFSPDELTSRAKQQQEETSTLAGEIVRWFIQEKHLGEMYQRENVIQRLSEYTSSPVEKTRNGLQSVIGDIVDPVQQIVVDGNRYVGAIKYIEFEDSGAYGYIHFDDRLGKRKRVVCAKCVQEETLDENVVHATQGQGSSDIDATWDELVNKVKAHYNRSHDSQPEEIYPGASLVSGTTIGGNGAYHKGNLADRGAVTISPSTNNQTIPEGYHNGNGFVEGDGGLTSGNIKSGVSIFGVNGDFEPSVKNLDFSNTPAGFTPPSPTQSYSNSGSEDVSGGFPSKVKKWDPPIPVTSATVTKYGRDKMFLIVEDNGETETYTDTGIDGSVTVNDVRVKKLEVTNNFFRDTSVEWSIDADLDVYQIIKDSANVS